MTSNNSNIVKYVRDSTGKGNYKGTNEEKLIPTGSIEDYKVYNIYDMAGNCWEWTIEAFGVFSRTDRAGGRGIDATFYPVSSRDGIISPKSSTKDRSSRITLVI